MSLQKSFIEECIEDSLEEDAKSLREQKEKLQELLLNVLSLRVEIENITNDITYTIEDIVFSYRYEPYRENPILKMLKFKGEKLERDISSRAELGEYLRHKV